MTPIIIFLITHFILKEKSRWWQFIGFTMACVGAYLLVSIKGVNFNQDTLLGDLLVLCNSTVYALFMVLVTPLMKKYHPVTVMKYVFTFAIPVALPFTYSAFIHTPWGDLPSLAWWSLAFIVGFGTIYNYYVNTWSLKHVSPSVNGGYIYLIPLLTAMVAVLMNQDSLSTPKVIYGLLIIAGVYLVNKKTR
jgi:drug/metabolite transporter (DMT)-like permease